MLQKKVICFTKTQVSVFELMLDRRMAPAIKPVYKNQKLVLIWRLLSRITNISFNYKFIMLSRITNISFNYKFIMQFFLQKFTPPLCFRRAIEGFNVVTAILKVGKGQDIVFQYWNPI